MEKSKENNAVKNDNQFEIKKMKKYNPRNDTLA